MASVPESGTQTLGLSGISETIQSIGICGLIPSPARPRPTHHSQRKCTSNRQTNTFLQDQDMAEQVNIPLALLCRMHAECCHDLPTFRLKRHTRSNLSSKTPRHEVGSQVVGCGLHSAGCLRYYSVLVGKKVSTKEKRWYKDVGLGFKTTAEAVTGTYIGTPLGGGAS